MIKAMAVFGLLGAIAGVTPTFAQERPGEMTLHSEIAFRGRSFTVTGPREHIRTNFRVRSVTVAPGDRWEVCPQARYRGRCQIVDQNSGNILWTVASARPVQAIVPPIGNLDQSLRGMSAEFFPRPSDSRGRVASCTTGSANCAAQAAARFCRSRGWAHAVHSRQETVAGRIYLADVLCSQSQ